jgi:hypothetical protein
VGLARVEGKGKVGRFAAGKGVEARHAIENGEQPILLLGKDGTALAIERLPETVRATGRLRVGEKGVLILDVERLDEDGKKGPR